MDEKMENGHFIIMNYYINLIILARIMRFHVKYGSFSCDDFLL